MQDVAALEVLCATYLLSFPEHTLLSPYFHTACGPVWVPFRIEGTIQVSLRGLSLYHYPTHYCWAEMAKRCSKESPSFWVDYFQQKPRLLTVVSNEYSHHHSNFELLYEFPRCSNCIHSFQFIGICCTASRNSLWFGAKFTGAGRTNLTNRETNSNS